MLKLSTKTRYGLRAMIELAMTPPGEPLEMSTIAQRQKLSRKYLHALLSTLKDAGLTESVRGAKGGYRLSRPASEIRISEIYEILEGRLSVVDCVAEPECCTQLPSCRTAPLWQRLNTALVEVLYSTTLADLSQPMPETDGDSGDSTPAP
jgi:Rrf2 family protein